jgi:surface polysaccharide O-acyltransferase-like enzyme
MHQHDHCKVTSSKLHETMVHVEWLALVIVSYLIGPLIALIVRFHVKKHNYKTC